MALFALGSSAQTEEITKDLLIRAESYLFNQPDSARYFMDRAYDQALHEEGSILTQVYRYYGIYYHLQSQYDTAISFYQRSADLAQRLGEQEIYVDATSNMGLAFSAQGSLGKAQEKLLEALEYYEQENLPLKASNAYNNIGIVLQKSGDLKGAKETYKKANKIHPEKHLGALSNLAAAFENENNLDSALNIYDTLELAFGESNNLRSLFSVYSNKVIVYDKLGDEQQVASYSKKCALLGKQMGNQNGLSILYQNLADYYFKQSRYGLSRQYLDSGYAAAAKAENLEVFAKLKNREAELEEQSGRYAQAVEAFKAFHVLSDSLRRQEQAEVVTELNIKYETVSNQQKIAELELQKKSAALSLVRSNNQRNILILGLSALILAAGLLYYLYYTKKKTSDILSVKNNQISQALAERETLLKEIHHRVKNNLQVISSLLNLQAGSLEDEAAVEAVRQGQHRVKSMALIHQRLYSTDDVRGVDIDDYFNSLFVELFTAFGVDQDLIEYKVETTGLKLDIDTVIPLGLIVNELVTNAIKYAFDNGQSGEIQFQIEQRDGQLLAFVKDNGKGMDEKSLQKANSFGWRMMRSLARKLKAEIEITNDSGTRVDLIISRYKLVA
ncbi:MAG: histidine kinase dimerization/phosphoacceptor domain -containing protein [Cyclobacteriaceae bacterium]